MYSFKNVLLNAVSLKQGAKNRMKRFGVVTIAVIGLTAIFTAHAQNINDVAKDDAAKARVFQAAGPNVASIQGAVDDFRLALGANNGIVAPPEPLKDGRREINWDGGGSVATTETPTPLDTFLVGRGARFTTPGSGFVQAPAAGLADVFKNESYATIFRAFSPVRLFSAVDSAVTDTLFFVPGGGEVRATTRGFGVIFSDVDLPDGTDDPAPRQANKHSSTVIEYFDAAGELLFSSFAPSSPGDGNQSFLGIVFDDARIARVRITVGATPGSDDSRKRDVVMMDDFIYGEPQAIH